MNHKTGQLETILYLLDFLRVFPDCLLSKIEFRQDRSKFLKKKWTNKYYCFGHTSAVEIFSLCSFFLDAHLAGPQKSGN